MRTQKSLEAHVHSTLNKWIPGQPKDLEKDKHFASTLKQNSVTDTRNNKATLGTAPWIAPGVQSTLYQANAS
jgi:hypothetical protein